MSNNAIDKIREMKEERQKLMALRDELKNAKAELNAEKERVNAELNKARKEIDSERKKLAHLQIMANREVTPAMLEELEEMDVKETEIQHPCKISIRTKKSLFVVPLEPDEDGNTVLGVLENRNYFTERVVAAFNSGDAKTIAKAMKALAKKKPSQQKEILRNVLTDVVESPNSILDDDLDGEDETNQETDVDSYDDVEDDGEDVE